MLWHSDEGGVRIYCHAEDVAPFSWMKSIVISESDYDEAGREIVLHERGHIQSGHSWDVVLLTVVQMVQWWNPMCYMPGISLRDVHEYEADDYVLRQGVSAQGYQLLLIRKAVGSGSYAFANSFNHSLTKKRITMMKKSRSNPWMRASALYVIPVAALALSAFATPKFTAPIEEAVTNLEGKGTENSATLQASGEEKKAAPEGKRPMKELKEVYLNGKLVTDSKQVLGISSEEIVSVAVVGNERAYIETDSIYDRVAHIAKFPDGEAECYKFLAEKVRYPKLCQYFGVQGHVFVSFVVEKDGSITHISKAKGPSRELSQVEVVSYRKDNPDAAELPEEGQDLGELLYEEAKRVLELMPKWEPARDSEGNAVRSRMNLPVMFRLR